MDNFQNIREAAQQQATPPPSRAWNKLEQKLDADIVQAKRVKRLRRNRLYSFASMALLISVFYLIVHESKKTPPIAHGQIASWEELSLDDEPGLYNLDYLRNLNATFDSDYLNGLLGNQSSSGTNFLRIKGTH